MKYFTEGRTENGYGKPGIGIGRVFSIRAEDGKFVFTEECDGYFSEEYTKEQAIELLKEAMAWIEEQK
jgi:hypothetical protein